MVIFNIIETLILNANAANTKQLSKPEKKRNRPLVNLRGRRLKGKEEGALGKGIPFPLPFRTPATQASPWSLIFSYDYVHLWLLTREFWQPRRRRERQKSNRLIKQNNNFALASSFSVHFVAVTARLRREMPSFTCCGDVNKSFFLFLNLSTVP